MGSYVADAGDFDDIRQEAARMARIDTRTVEQGLAGIEGLLADPPHPPGTLAQLVARDANWKLPDRTSDVAAAEFLGELADLLRDVLRACRCIMTLQARCGRRLLTCTEPEPSCPNTPGACGTPPAGRLGMWWPAPAHERSAGTDGSGLTHTERPWYWWSAPRPI
ncbi:MAG: hypothetical protein JOZ87_37705 [Chloroflexi bacterium]|nr:hypothetical protein [Chloroflexota bacterium]